MVDVITNIASLRQRASAGNSIVTVLGAVTANDGAGGVYYWDATDTTSTDNGATVIQVTGVSTGRWKLASEFIYQKNNAFLTGTGNRLLQSDATGSITASSSLIDGFVVDTDIINAIAGATYNSGNNFTAGITSANGKNMYQGQMYASGNYLYIAILDNLVKRLAGA